MKRLVFAISGASGMALAQRILDILHNEVNVQVHLIVSKGAKLVMQTETQDCLANFTSLVHTNYDANDLAAGPASGSWQHDGMIICPCSMNSLASIAHGIGSNLIHRAADVTLKERRKLLIVPRESPLSSIHLQNMYTLSQHGAIIMPFCPAFYMENHSLDHMIAHFCGRLLDQFGVEHSLCQRWKDNK